MTEDIYKNSFFDQKDFKQLQFLKPAPKHTSDLNTSPTIHSSLTSKSLNNTICQKGVHAIHNNLLVFYGDSINSSPQTVLDISFAKIKVLPAAQDSQTFNVIIARTGASFELQFKEQKDLDDWIRVFRGICLLDSFHEDYKALKMIGRGGFAKVFLVESKLDGNQYAAKAFVKDNLTNNKKTNHKAALINEIEIMKALTHDNIIKLYEVHETDKSIYLVMELISGKPLQEFLRHLHSEENSDSRITGMAYSILDALAYLASKGIMHRDLKPANILLDQYGKIKIIDFGLATYINAPNYIFKKCGTPGYIAPEIFNYDPDVPSTFYNDRCDVFSAGCILYYMLFKKPLIIATNASKAMDLNKDFDDIEIIYLVKKELARPESVVNKEGLNALLRMLKSNAKARPKAEEMLQHAFFSNMLNKSKSYTPRINIFPEASSPSIRRSSSDYTSTGSITSALMPYKSRYAVKNSFIVDLGNPELNGNLATISNGSVINSIAIKRDTNNGNPNSVSHFAAKDPIKEKFGNQKTKGLSKSFKVQNTNQTFLKAAILKNASKQQEHGEEGPKISIFSPQTLKPTRSNSDDVVIEYKNMSSYEEADSSELGELDDENCHVGSEGLRAFNPKSNQKKVRRSIRLKFQ